MFPNVRGERTQRALIHAPCGQSPSSDRGRVAEGASLFGVAALNDGTRSFRISVALVNINDCVDKIDPAKGRAARCSFSRRVFISAPHFPHGILHVCVSQGGDERVEHGAIMV